MALRRGLSLSLGVVLAAARARADPARPERLTIVGEFGAAVTLPSAYGTALEAFGYERALLAARGAARVLAAPTERTRLGGRVGYQYHRTTATPLPDGEDWPLTTPGASAGPLLATHLVDAGAVGRYLLLRDPVRRLRVDAELELGFAFAVLTFGDTTDWALLPRAAVSFFVGNEFGASGWVGGLRLGVQYLPWGAAGAGILDPAFAGVTVGFELGASP